MKNKIILIIFSMFLLVFTFNVVSSVPPFQSSNGDLGYIIEVPILEKFNLNENITIHNHVYNISNGVIISNLNVECMIHIYNDKGNHIVEDIMDKDSNGVDHEFKYIFTELGNHPILIDCQDTYGGFFQYNIEVIEPIEDDKNYQFDFTDTTNLVILFIVLIGTFVLIYFNLIIFAGIIWFILGMIMFISGMNFILSGFVLLVGGLISLYSNK